MSSVPRCPASTVALGGAGGNADEAGGAGADVTVQGADIGGGFGGLFAVDPFLGGPGPGGEPGRYITESSCGHTGSASGTPGNPGGVGYAPTGTGGGTSVPPGPGQGSGGGGGGGLSGGGEGGTGAAEWRAISGQPTTYLDAGDGGGGGGASGVLTGNTNPVSNVGLDDTGNSGQVNGGNGEAVLSYADPVSTGPASYSTTGPTLTVTAADGLLSAGAGTSGPASTR